MSRDPRDERERGSARKPKKERSRVQWQGFVDIPLSAENKTEVSQMSREADDILGILVALVDAGYKVSLTHDAAHNAHIASATGVRDEGENAGYSLSARGPDTTGAINALWFKHAFLAQEGVWANVGAMSSDSGYG